jgi:hypothetical protein
MSRRRNQPATNEVTPEIADVHYEQGTRAAWRTVLAHCVKNLNDAPLDAEHLLLEREATVNMLRTVCERFGDNDWTPQLHLADVIEKHLLRHLANE